MKPHAPRSLKKMLLMAFLLAGLMPALLVSMLSFYQARLALRTEIKHDLQTTGQAVAEHIEQVLFERVQNVRSWSQLAVMQDMQIGDIDKRLSVFLKETQASYAQQYLSLDVIDIHGQIVASSHSAHLAKTLTLPPVWFTFDAHGQFITVRRLQQEQLRISAPIVSIIHLKPIGQLVVSFDWKVIIQLLNHAAQHSTELALLDHQQQLLAHSDNWTQQSHSLHTRARLQSTLPWAGWIVQMNKAHDVAVAPVHRLGAIFLILLGLVSLVALLIVTPLARSISLPLEALTQFVQQWRRPQCVPPALSGPSEVQALQRSFSQMIHDLHTYEQQLTQAAKLAVVGEMSAAISHEVRTPLGIMRSSAEVLLREPALTADGREVLGFIISETERLNKLVSALIDAARPRTPNKIPLDLAAHLQHVVSMLQKQAEAKHIQLQLNAHNAVTVLADQDQMTQVWLNLLMNAIQILPAGENEGEPSGQIVVQLKTKDGQACISVADNGPGVPAAQQAQLFEAFFTQRAGGVGLGLAVVKQIIEAHGGKISYAPSPMQYAEFVSGAQFDIVLPINHAQTESPT